MKQSKMALSLNSRYQNRKEHPNRPKNNGDMTERAKPPVSG